jgi:hypothetical protein
MALVLSNQDFNSTSRIINLPAPISATEPVRLQDLNSAVEGLSWKDSCRVAAGSDINVAAPGATIDGIVMALNDRVLLTSQTDQTENGIYIWNGAAVGLTRSLDASTNIELESATTLIEEGSSEGVSYRQTTTNFVLGTQAVIWTTFGTNAPSSTTTTAGLLRIATQAEVDAGVVTNAAITPGTLANYAARVKKFSVAIGDGSATTYTVTHNLNSLDVVINVYRVTGGGTVIVDTDRTSANAAQITFASAPATGAYRVVVIG